MVYRPDRKRGTGQDSGCLNRRTNLEPVWRLLCQSGTQVSKRCERPCTGLYLNSATYLNNSKMTEIKINGREYPIKWGLQQSIEYCDLRGVSISDYQKDLGKITSDMGILRDMVWSALKDGARKAKQEFALSNMDVSDLLDEATAEESKQIVETLAGTLPQDRSKKKAVGKKVT